MITVIPGASRGATQLDWLDSKHTFSFADYYNTEMMGFGPLRVINEDVVAPGAGFGAHPHRDMEIITYVVQGALEHRDSTGGGEILRAGEVQRMTAGRGVVHSETNASANEPVHFFQIWIKPDQRGLQPGYEEKRIAFENNQWTLLVAPEMAYAPGALTIHQDVQLFAGKIDAGRALAYSPAHGNAWLQVVRGEVRLGDKVLYAGDGAAIQQEKRIDTAAITDAEVLLFDVPTAS